MIVLKKDEDRGQLQLLFQLRYLDGVTDKEVLAQALGVFKENALERERMEGIQAKQREAEEARLRAEAERATKVGKMIEEFDAAANMY